MSMNDTIADFLTRVRNAQRARLETVRAIHSKTNENIASILKQEGFVDGYEVVEDEKQKATKTLVVRLRYSSAMTPVIQGLQRISTPGRRRYATYKQLEEDLQTFTTTIVSTPKGVLTDREAVEHKVGGELLCQVS